MRLQTSPATGTGKMAIRRSLLSRSKQQRTRACAMSAMINPAFRAGARARNSNISIRRESRFVTNNDCCASSASLSRRHGAMSGFVHRLMGISRPSDVMPGDENNTDIMNAGGKSRREQIRSTDQLRESAPENSQTAEERFGSERSASGESARNNRAASRVEPHPRWQWRVCARKQIARSHHHARSTCRRERLEAAVLFSR